MYYEKIFLTISLFSCVNNLTSSDNQKYRYTGQAAIDHLIETGECVQCDVSGQDLRAAIKTINDKQKNPSVYSSIINLSHANMTDANMARANMYKANMTNANMARADITDADMTGANMTNAFLYKANMADAFMYEANMTNAFMYEANMTNANMTGANMTAKK